jgi:hypothetical protein
MAAACRNQSHQCDDLRGRDGGGGSATGLEVAVAMTARWTSRSRWQHRSHLCLPPRRRPDPKVGTAKVTGLLCTTIPKCIDAGSPWVLHHRIPSAVASLNLLLDPDLVCTVNTTSPMALLDPDLLCDTHIDSELILDLAS